MDSLNGSKGGGKIIQMPSLDHSPDSRGIGYAFFTNMLEHKNKVAQIDALTGERDTFGSLLQRCIRTAINMRLKGVTPGDVITVCSFNHLNSCVPFVSAHFLGAKVASLDPTLSLTETAYLLKQVTPKLIFVVPETVELMELAVSELPVKAEIVVFGDTSKHARFSDFLKPSDEESTFEPHTCKNFRDTAVICFSSGTSGFPKGICLSHFNFLHQLLNFIANGYCHDVTLSFASLYWGTSVLFLGISIITGLPRLIVAKFDPNTVWQTINKYKPTFSFMAPSQILAMCNKGRPVDIDTSSLKDISVGGAPILEKQILQIRKVLPGTRVHSGYGLSEVCGFLLCFKASNPKELDYIEKKPGTCGTPMPGASYKVVDPETEEILGPHQEGELRVKTEFQMNGYHNQDSSSAWDSEGWLKTGDIAYYDDDCCFFIVDRIKEMLKFQSWHVQPAILEGVLLTHPNVAAAVVIGVPHEIDGDHPMGIVVLEDPTRATLPERIVKYVEDRVHDRQRLRGGVKIVDHIPTTPSGKVKRKIIRDMVLKGSKI